MGFLTHLFYPWGFIVQLLAIVHLLRRRGPLFWFFIIIMGGFIGAIAYILIEILPDAYLLRVAFDRHARKSRIAGMETKIIDNPSAGNLEELAELYFDQKEFVKAREYFHRAIATRADSDYAFYHRALCAVELNDLAGAIPDLERVVGKELKFDYWRAAGLLAHAYAQTGNAERAGALFAEVIQQATLPETLYNYASFLKSQNQIAEAREWAQRILDKKRTMPRYVQNREAAWFGKAKALLKELRQAQPAK
jgi:hypothetical protein